MTEEEIYEAEQEFAEENPKSSYFTMITYKARNSVLYIFKIICEQIYMNWMIFMVVIYIGIFHCVISFSSWYYLFLLLWIEIFNLYVANE